MVDCLFDFGVGVEEFFVGVIFGNKFMIVWIVV